MKHSWRRRDKKKKKKLLVKINKEWEKQPPTRR
jgi:hypothetical protein